MNFDRANPAVYAVTISKKDQVISELTIVAAPGSVAQMTAPGPHRRRLDGAARAAAQCRAGVWDALELRVVGAFDREYGLMAR